MSFRFNFQNSYNQLPELFYSKVKGTLLDQPQLLWWNKDLAKELDLGVASIEDTVQIFSGNQLPSGSACIAQAYAGHQFGYFTMLGDGRAILIGEHLNKEGKRFDLQLKGSGRTPYSRNGDGKATLYSMLRECLISEMMFNLNVPTARSLALVDSGEEVIREQIQRGAVLTRVAKSHLRVGTFEMARRFGTTEDLRRLADYAIDRHYPQFKEEEEKYFYFLKAVIQTQIKTVVDWMRVGFIHGVMNTDNMSISGETFDYGPCAFLNSYDLNKKYSSIDRQGRYAFGNQPQIAQWNLARFAESLIPLLDDQPERGLELAQEAIDQFPTWYKASYHQMINKKLGCLGQEYETLGTELLDLMEKNQLDYTNTFLYLEWRLCEGEGIADEKYKVLDHWIENWKEKLKAISVEESLKLMRVSNPTFIPRNDEVEKVINAVSKTGKIEQLKAYLELHQQTYDRSSFDISNCTAHYHEEENYQTFCGT